MHTIEVNVVEDAAISLDVIRNEPSLCTTRNKMLEVDIKMDISEDKKYIRKIR